MLVLTVVLLAPSSPAAPPEGTRGFGLVAWGRSNTYVSSQSLREPSHLGCTTRNKEILFVKVQVYSVALYAEADKAAKELGVRARGGFFSNDNDYCQALLDGAFSKALMIRLLRDVDGATFADALNKSLVPRMTIAGEQDLLKEFMTLFEAKKLTNQTEISLFTNVAGETEVLVVPSPSASYASSTPEKKYKSAALARALMEIFLGDTPVVQGAKEEWAAGAKLLLESEQVKRNLA
jgi:hypothetical protein